MSLNDTVSAERLHISFFGRRNVGKSSLVNAVTGQSLSVVSPVKGTTTDPVQKAMELLPLGPVVIIDTPGYDDVGELGALRVKKTNEILGKTDIAVLVYDAVVGMQAEDQALLAQLRARKLPVILVANKSDLLSAEAATDTSAGDAPVLVSAVTGAGVHALKERLADLGRRTEQPRFILADLV
ncbi:MAG: 50S ribosome-binding GTPase, partial [Oscillospiraceae bacterium]|nr:50S ribosome-binding GTPase [Oscillospiraceae bacterium]